MDRKLVILKRLLKGESVSPKSLSCDFEKSVRTIERDLLEIKEVFGDENFERYGKNYKLITNSYLSKILDFTKDDLKILVDMLSLLNYNLKDLLDDDYLKMIEKIKDEYSSVYSIKEQVLENILYKKDTIASIKNIISNRYYCRIKYISDKEYIFRNVKVFKIIVQEGNFYLATLTEDEGVNNGFKLLRLSFIEEIKPLSTRYNKNLSVETFIKKDLQTLFSQYQVPKYNVLLEVDAKVTRFFQQKKFLSSQTLDSKLDNGNEIYKFTITNDMEILRLVRTWIPNIKILSPTKTKDKFIQELKQSLDLHKD